MSEAFQSASELSRRIRQKEISSRELTDFFIRRIEKHDKGLNAVVVRDFERAREAADAADAALARGDVLGPLHGLPMTIKEAYDLAGTPTTWGDPRFENNIAAADAESVKRYKAAGAHFLGKTNVPLGLADLQSYNDIYGQTNNPWNALRVPGGSSGGSAAALAAGLTGLESGSDIGGSIRIPSHFCGVYGHKPTWGIVPDQGHALPGVVASPDIAVVGPMARSAGDLAVALDVVAGADAFRQAGWKLALPRPAKRSLTEYRVAIWPSDDAVPVSTEISDRIQSLGDRLASLGAVVSDSARPAFDAAHSYDVYMCMLNGEMAAEFPDEVFEGIRTAVAGLEDSNQTIQAKALRASVQTHREWLKANHRRARLRQQWRRFFEDFDIVLCPVALRTAFPHDHSPFAGRTLEVDGAKRSYMDLLFWSGLVTVSYLPSTVFPTGPSSEGLPIGVQAVGAEFADHTCIDFARLMAGEIGGFAAPEGYDD